MGAAHVPNACTGGLVGATVPPMNNHEAGGTSLLAEAFTRRMTQLGMTRRQLTRLTGLSRQTLHNIEREGRTDLKPATYAAIDKGLRWRAGTALALANGDASVLEAPDEQAIIERESAYRWQIVERIQTMSLVDLERMVALLEGQTLGDDSLSTDDVIARVEERVMRRLEERLRSHDPTHDGSPA